MANTKTKIYAPNKAYCGVSASVPFVNGVGETDDKHLINWFKSKGYSVGKPIDGKVQEDEKIEK